MITRIFMLTLANGRQFPVQHITVRDGAGQERSYLQRFAHVEVTLPPPEQYTLTPLLLMTPERIAALAALASADNEAGAAVRAMLAEVTDGG